MSDPRILVVYYSRTGNTRAVARDIAVCLGAELEEITDTVKRTGWLGFVRAGRDARKGRLTQLASRNRDVRNYDLVIVGTPVWGSSVSVPVRTYLAAHAEEFPRVAFFLTLGGMGRDRAVAQMTHTCGVEPDAVLAVNEREIDRRTYLHRVGHFAHELLADHIHQMV